MQGCCLFFYRHLKSAFSKHECNKTSTESCILTIWIFKAKLMIKDKYQHAFGQKPFPN